MHWLKIEYLCTGAVVVVEYGKNESQSLCYGDGLRLWIPLTWNYTLPL